MLWFGDLFLDTTSVEMLKHYAEDAGKSEEEIALLLNQFMNQVLLQMEQRKELKNIYL